MGHQVIKQPNGRYAVFSSVVDNFILVNCVKGEIRAYYIEKATEEANAQVDRMVGKADGEIPGNQFTMNFEEALETMERIHGKDTVNKFLEEYQPGESKT